MQWIGLNAMPEHAETCKAYISPIKLNKKLKKKVYSIEIGTNYEHQKAKDYLPQHRSSNNSSITAKMTASNNSCRELHQQKPLTIPCGRRPRK
jgi:hypothetical protein